MRTLIGLASVAGGLLYLAGAGQLAALVGLLKHAVRVLT